MKDTAIAVIIIGLAPCIVWWASWLQARKQSRVIKFKDNVR